MSYEYKKQLVPYSQKLRREMTTEEKHLWYDFLKKLPISVKRQKIINNYIVDFYIPIKQVVIELDGIHHGRDENKENDEVRDGELNQLGITVLRYSNDLVNNSFNAVCRDILKNLELSEEEYVKSLNSLPRKEQL